MRRIHDSFVDLVGKIVGGFTNKRVLEIGCGDGRVTEEIVRHGCFQIFGIDPDEEKIAAAKEKHIPSTRFDAGSATSLPLTDKCCDVTLFTLALHHIPRVDMERAIDEAVRVTRFDGRIVFLEPTNVGPFFDAEIRFGACDGDERLAKMAALKAMKDHKRISPIYEGYDRVAFRFDSDQDFRDSMNPKRNLELLRGFLHTHGHELWAERRINIFRPL